MDIQKWMHLPGAAAAGFINGILGTGGGMVLIPWLQKSKTFRETEIFPVCVGIIGPICAVSLIYTALDAPLPLKLALPYCIGSFPGGLAAGLWGDRIPLQYLHLILGAFMIWGGIKSLWPIF